MSRGDLFASWAGDAELFVSEVIGVEPDKWQRRVLRAASDGHLRIAMKACKGPGKSTVLSWLMLWFLTTRPFAKVVATSITADNLRDGLWTELSKWIGKSQVLSSLVEWAAERVVMLEDPSTWFASARTWPKSGDPTQQADTLAGLHADHLMFVLDEVGGIPRPVMAAAEAGLANVGDGRTALLVIAGNPTDPDGPLYDAFTKDAGLWWRIEITGDPDDPERSPRVSVEWAREQIAKWGRDNPWVLVNVFGRFPPTASNKLLGVEDIGEAERRVLVERDFREEPRILGVDVARFGDDASVAVLRQGRACFKAKQWRNLDLMTLAGQVALLLHRHKPHAVFIDVTGLGAGVVDRLAQLGHEVTGVDFGSKADEGKHFNKRMEMWWLMASWLKGGGAIPEDAELRADLLGPTYSFTPDGKLKLESKEDMKKRGVPSPNKGDALALTFAYPVAPPVVVTDGEVWREVSPHHLPVRPSDYNPMEKQRDYDPFARE